MSSYVDDVIAKEASVQSLGPSPEQEEEGANIALRVRSLTLSSFVVCFIHPSLFKAEFLIPSAIQIHIAPLCFHTFYSTLACKFHSRYALKLTFCLLLRAAVHDFVESVVSHQSANVAQIDAHSAAHAADIIQQGSTLLSFVSCSLLPEVYR